MYALIHKDHMKEIIDNKQVEEKYKAKFVLECCLKSKTGEWVNMPFALFYTEEKHPQGSNYFAVYLKPGFMVGSTDLLMISDGITAVYDKLGNHVTYSAVVDEEKNVALHSAYRHDYQTYDDLMIDGGRDYTKTNGKPIEQFIIENGEIVFDF